MICKECDEKATLISIVVPSGKDKDELASLTYKCSGCGKYIETTMELGDKGGMTQT